MAIYLSTAWKSTLRRPVTGVGVLYVASTRLHQRARAAGFATKWYEDNIFDRVDYAGHGKLVGDSYHFHFQDVPFVDEKDARGAGMAVDANVVSSQEMSWFRGQAAFLREHGVAYNLSEGSHLHFDCGPYVNAGSTWTRPTWVGKPTNGLLVEDGAIGVNTLKALQRRLAAKRLYAGPIDGQIGPGSSKAIAALTKSDKPWRDALRAHLGIRTPWDSGWCGFVLQTQLNIAHIAKGRLA